jgi:ABC-type phosphate transport system permease subunit
MVPPARPSIFGSIVKGFSSEISGTLVTVAFLLYFLLSWSTLGLVHNALLMGAFSWLWLRHRKTSYYGLVLFMLGTVSSTVPLLLSVFAKLDGCDCHNTTAVEIQ